MFCTIKFVYYKSFCVRDDIGSYIRTVYHMVSHTPKRKAVCSNHIGDAILRKCEGHFSMGKTIFAFFLFGPIAKIAVFYAFAGRYSGYGKVLIFGPAHPHGLCLAW